MDPTPEKKLNSDPTLDKVLDPDLSFEKELDPDPILQKKTEPDPTLEKDPDLTIREKNGSGSTDPLPKGRIIYHVKHDFSWNGYWSLPGQYQGI